jgi:signal peptidase I
MDSSTVNSKLDPIQIESKTVPPQSQKNWLRDGIEVLTFALITAIILRELIIGAYRIPSGSMENTLLIGDFLLVNKFIYGAVIPFTDWRLPAIKDLESGDVVVFKYPLDKETNYIKRCVAAAGQTLEIRNKHVFVDGRELILPIEGKWVDSQIQPVGNPTPEIFPRYSSFNRDNYGTIRIPKKGDTLTLSDKTFYLYKWVLEHEGHSAAMMGEQVYLDGKPTKNYLMTQNYYFMMGDNRDNSSDSRFWGFVPETHIVGSALLIYWSWNPDISLLNPTEKMATIRWNRLGSLIR